MDDTLYSVPHNPPVLLTVEILQEILQKVPKETKIAMYNPPECDGYYYIRYITYDVQNGRIVLEGPDSAKSNTCREMDEGAGWEKN
jgi:hypothetical protein